MEKNDSLHNLLLRLGNGDPSAFDALYVRMREPLCNKILSKYGSTLSMEDAEDAVQNAFIRIKHHASGYNGKYNEASAHKWLNTIVFHEAFKMVEASKRISISLDDDKDGTYDFAQNKDAVPEGSPYKSDLYREGSRSVEDHAERAILLGKVLAGAQQCLTVEEMRLLSMRFSFEYTFEQIGCEIGKTKVRAKQIIDALIERIRKSIGVDLTHFDGL